jgi:hypothetical protein
MRETTHGGSHAHAARHRFTSRRSCARRLDLLIAERMKRSFATTQRPRIRRDQPVAELNTRHIPHEVRRQVLARDGARCTFVSTDGKRCAQRALLELHHEQPFGRGGPATVENIRVLCTAQHRAQPAPGRARLRPGIHARPHRSREERARRVTGQEAELLRSCRRQLVIANALEHAGPRTLTSSIATRGLDYTHSRYGGMTPESSSNEQRPPSSGVYGPHTPDSVQAIFNPKQQYSRFSWLGEEHGHPGTGLLSPKGAGQSLVLASPASPPSCESEASTGCWASTPLSSGPEAASSTTPESPFRDPASIPWSSSLSPQAQSTALSKIVSAK